MKSTYGKVVVKTSDGLTDVFPDAAYIVDDGLLYVYTQKGNETYGFPLAHVVAFGKWTAEGAEDA